MTKTKHDHPVRIRLQELGPEIERRAKAETGGNRSRLIRRALKSYLEGDSQRVEDTAGLLVELRGLRSEFHRIGSNFNQIARALNMEDPVVQEEILAAHMELRREFNEVKILFEAVADDIAKTI